MYSVWVFISAMGDGDNAERAILGLADESCLLTCDKRLFVDHLL